MAFKLIISLFFIALSTISFAEISIINNDIYISGKKLESDLHPDIVGSNLFINKNTIQISNSYNAASDLKTEVNYFFNALDEKLKRVEWIAYSTEYERYYGYTINFPNGKKISDINNDYIDNLEAKFGFEDYFFERKNNKIILKLKLQDGKELSLETYDKETSIIINYNITSDGEINKKYELCKFEDLKTSNIACKQLGFINSKTFLYSEPSSKHQSNMYLIKNDQVILLEEKTDNNQKWYFINYKGKKDINMWIKAEAVDLKE